MRLLKLAPLATALLLALASARAAQLTLNPVQDVLITSNGELGEPRSLAVSNRGPDYIRRTFFQFDLSHLPAGAAIEKAALSLIPNAVIGKEGGLVPLALWGVTDSVSWHEDSIAWESAPKRRVLLEQGYGEPGLERLVALEWNASTDLARRPPLVFENDALTAYVRRFAGKPVTLILVSEGGLKTPGVVFFSKDNRPVAKSVYPALLVTVK